MTNYSEQNKKAWEYDAYDFWIKHNGTPKEFAKKALNDPTGMLKRYANYFDEYEGAAIANICGSCGKKAIPLAILGAIVTVFDISEDNRRYALEAAKAAEVKIDFVAGDVLDIDMIIYKSYFDVVFMEGGILHYFSDINPMMDIMNQIIKPGGKMICSDFHPFQKITDILNFEQPTTNYFSTEMISGEMAHAKFYPEEIRSQFPLCWYRKYTLSEIINAVLDHGFQLQRFHEHPAWTNPALPSEFTLIAKKEEASL